MSGASCQLNFKVLQFTCKHFSMLHSNSQLARNNFHKLLTNCLRAACSKLLKQIWNKLSDLLQGCSNMYGWCSRDITTLLYPCVVNYVAGAAE